MLSLYRNPPKVNKRKQKISIREQDLEKPQMTSNDHKKLQSTSSIEMIKPNTIKKNKLKEDGSIEINDNQLDEILHNNNV